MRPEASTEPFATVEETFCCRRSPSQRANSNANFGPETDDRYLLPSCQPSETPKKEKNEENECRVRK